MCAYVYTWVHMGAGVIVELRIYLNICALNVGTCACAVCVYVHDVGACVMCSTEHVCIDCVCMYVCEYVCLCKGFWTESKLNFRMTAGLDHSGMGGGPTLHYTQGEPWLFPGCLLYLGSLGLQPNLLCELFFFSKMLVGVGRQSEMPFTTS